MVEDVKGMIAVVERGKETTSVGACRGWNIGGGEV